MISKHAKSATSVHRIVPWRFNQAEQGRQYLQVCKQRSVLVGKLSVPPVIVKQFQHGPVKSHGRTIGGVPISHQAARRVIDTATHQVFGQGIWKRVCGIEYRRVAVVVVERVVEPFEDFASVLGPL